MMTRRRLAWWVGCAVSFVPGMASALTVRSDRPRLYLSNGTGFGPTVATLQQRCADTTNYKGCMGSLAQSGGGPESYAAGYVIQGDASQCTQAVSLLKSNVVLPTAGVDPHSFTSDNGGQMFSLSIVRDWCAPALAAADVTWLESTMVTLADWYVNYGNGLDVFFDDTPNVWSAISLAGLAMAGGAQDAKAQGYLTAADTQWKTIIFPAWAYEGNYWHEGMTYAQVSLGLMGWYALAWSTATDDNVFMWAQTNANDLFNGYIDFFSYTMRPDYNYAYFGDTSDNKQSIQLFSRWLVDLLTEGTGSHYGQGLSLEIAQSTPAYYDYAGAVRWKMALLFDASKNASAQPRSSRPTAKWMSQGAQDVASLRSGWGPDDVFVYMTCGDYFSDHQHYESGAFHIARSGILTGPTGYYDSYGDPHWYDYYSQHSVHANTLAVLQPGEAFPNESTDSCAGQPEVNEGGQRPLQRDKSCDSWTDKDLPTYLSHKTAVPFLETGNMTAFQPSACFDYVGCNVTSAYSSPGFVMNGNTPKVSEVSRQLVFLHPEIVVVFDRVESTDASYQKSALVQDSTPTDTPVVTGTSFEFTNAAGAQLFGQTLLPASAMIQTLTNFSVDGTSYAPSPGGNESGGTRLEVDAPKGNTRDYFLHVFDAAAKGGKAPTASVTQDTQTVTATIQSAGTTYVVAFEKTGTLGGHVTVTPQDGGGGCDEPLGAGAAGDAGAADAQSPTGGTEGGTAPGVDAGTGSDAGPATGSASSKSGCGCTVLIGRGSLYPETAALAFIAACVARRGRRRSPREGKA